MRRSASRLLDFSARVFIVTFAIYLMLSAFLQSEGIGGISRTLDRLDEVFRTVNTMFVRLDRYVALLGLNEAEVMANPEQVSAALRLYGTTSNPEVHYQIALRKERRGDLDGAMLEMSLALGLVAPDEKKYRAKMAELQEALRKKAEPTS